LLAEEIRISLVRKRHGKFSRFYRMQDSLCICSDVNGVKEELGFSHHPKGWRLSVDASKLSLKAVLLHNGSVKPLIPVTHSVTKK
jgi:hypothetical protein